MVLLHDWETLCGDGTEEGVCMGVFCVERRGARQGFDEGDAVVGMRGGGVIQADDVDGHPAK